MTPPSVALRIVSGFGWLALLGAPPFGISFAQNPVPEAKPWSIPSDEAIQRILADRINAKRQGVGIVVGILQPTGRRIVSYGNGGAPGTRRLDGDSIFQLGSLTKTFTTLVLADMVARGEVRLEDKASAYLPGVTLPSRGRDITLRDLATHTSGLPSMPTNFDLYGDQNPYESYSADRLFQFLSTYALPREPGTKWQYSNLSVTLLGHALARRANTGYETLVKERVLKPLGMQDTAVTLSASQQERLAIGHDMYLSPVEQWNLPNMPGSGALRSTANDMLKFLAAYLNPRDSPLSEAMKLQLEVSAEARPGQRLGWQVSKVGEEEFAVHDGGKPGYRTIAAFNRKTQVGIVILANARSEDRLAGLALHLLVGRTLNTGQAPAPRTVAAQTREQLDSAAGRYRLTPETVLTVVRREDHLLMNIEGEGILEFYPDSATSFFCRTDNIQISLERDAGGTYSSMLYRENGKEQRAPRIGR